ncbi:MAG: hypothetical protein MI919_21285, partial [Holophagales bacterium]|nr:hypothetical protein [Holophagales bacterium]
PVDLLDDGGLGSFDSAEAEGGGAHDMEAAVARDRVVVVKRTDKKLVGIAAVVGLFVVAGGGFLALKWNDLFPNTDNSPAVPQPPRIDPIERATKMYEAGQVENAVILLEKVAPEEPSYEQTQVQDTQWRAEIEAPLEDQNTGPSEEMMERRGMLLSAAREAHGIGNYIRARKYFERANKILPLESEDQALRRDCDFALKPLEAELTAFADGKYEEVIPELWRKLDKDESNPDIRLLLVDSYYNLALTDLQRNNAASAAEKLAEALEVAPDNTDLQRIRLFAETYKSRSVDLLYRIYVKYLPSRS